MLPCGRDVARLVWLRQRRPNWSRELLSRGRAARPETTTRASWRVSRRHLLREGGVASPQSMARRHVWPASRPRLIFGWRRGGGQCRRQGHAPLHAGVLEWHITPPCESRMRGMNRTRRRCELRAPPVCLNIGLRPPSGGLMGLCPPSVLSTRRVSHANFPSGFTQLRLAPQTPREGGVD